MFSLIPKDKISSGAQKYWHQHIKVFSKFHLLMMPTKIVELKKILITLCIRSNLFKNFSRRDPSLVKLNQRIEYQPPEASARGCHILYVEVKQVSGEFSSSYKKYLSLNKPGSDPHDQLFHYKQCDIRQVWSFRIHKDLALNLTFQAIHILGNCHQGNVLVFDTQNPRQNFRFCGQYDKFTLYPAFSGISIEIYIHTFTEVDFVTEASFSLLDRNIIQSTNTNESPVSLLEPFKSYLVSEKRSVLLFRLKVKKIFILCFEQTASHRNAFVFDGPNEQFRTLKFENNSTTTSTFQCVLLLVMQNQKRMFVNYSSKLAPSAHQKHLSKNETYQLDFTTKQSNAMMQLFKLNTHFPFHLNLTVNIFVFQGETRQDCRFGGMVFTEAVNGNFREYPVLCQSEDQRKAQQRSFYSTQSSIYVVIFWYKNFSAMDISLNISQTACTPVRVCECTYFSLCILNFFQPRIRTKLGSESCHNYLNEVSLLTNNSLNFRQDRTFWSIPLRFSIPNTCFILQLIRNSSKVTDQILAEYEATNCYFLFAPLPLNRLDVQYNYTVRGDSELTESVRKYFKHAFSCKNTEVKLFGNAESICHAEVQSVTKCKKGVTGKKYDAQKSYISSCLSYFHKQQYLLTAAVKPPIDQFSMYISVVRHIVTMSWVEMAIFPTKTGNEKSFSHDLPILYLGSGMNSGNIPVKSETALKFDLLRGTSSRLLQIRAQTTCLQTHVLRWCCSNCFGKHKRTKYLSLPCKLKRLSYFNEDQYSVYLRFGQKYVEFCKELGAKKPPVCRRKVRRSVVRNIYQYLQGETPTISVSSVPDPFQDFKYLQHRKPHSQPCSVSLDSAVSCKKFTVSYDVHQKTTKHYLLFEALPKMTNDMIFRHISPKHRETAYKQLKSWSEVVKICRLFGAALPYFTSSKQQAHFIALFKFAPDLHPLQAIFIGLTFTAENQVLHHFSGRKYMKKKSILRAQVEIHGS